MNSYYPVGDIIVISICMVMIELMIFSYVRKTRNYRIFIMLLGCLLLAAVSNMLFHQLFVTGGPAQYTSAYVLRCIHHASLFIIFVLYAAYITEASSLGKKRTPYIAATVILFVLAVIAECIQAWHGIQYGLDSGETLFLRINVFLAAYIAFALLMIVIMFRVRNKVYRNVMMGFYGAIAISFIVLIIQSRHGQSSFTVATFLYPVIAMFYIMHSTPYDIELGAVDVRAFEDAVRDSYARSREFVLISLYLRSISEEGKVLPAEVSALIRKYSVAKFRGAILFRIARGHLALLVPKAGNPDYQNTVESILPNLYREYDRFRLDYKLIICESIDEISNNNEYVGFFRYIYRHMPENSIHRVNAEDVKRFKRNEYILHQLNDICVDPDMEDSRVLAYCQPVLNLKTRQYDTAEALMRLKLDDIGMVYPDEFIPLAEENGYIHSLTRIILSKTCAQIRTLLDAGYHVARVSVNVSVQELRSEAFCNNITSIIKNSGIPGDRIAIELTESQNESEFIIMKNKIAELREKGIKFYLDDFGTGYSNMERIMELPFDIIKFDRSLVLASEASDRSRKIVIGLARIFADMNYSILYEGVEADPEEKMCMAMDASYLQGYKYSKPIPIYQLDEFFEQRTA